MKNYSQRLSSFDIGRVFYISILILSGFSGKIQGQEVKVEISYDTVYAGNILAVRYSMEDWQADIDNPDFGDFEVAGGPQVTSSMSYSGGERSSSRTIVYYLRPPDQVGTYHIPSIIFRGEEKQFTTQAKAISVVANPEDIQQDPVFENNRTSSLDTPFDRSKPPRGERKRF